ncbi:MAG: DUF2846 domain-containing protein [Rhizobiales bacterium]|nr:DUF2846 domain-containing protein [Hyphomicrobiales bacterium]
MGVAATVRAQRSSGGGIVDKLPVATGAGGPRLCHEPQNRHASARDVRIYILRPRAWSYGTVGARVKMNSVEVGSLASNSYISLVRPAGRYTLNVSFPFDLGAAEHTFDVSAGRSYYFAVNIRSATMPIAGGGFFTIPGSEVGQQVGNSNLLAGSYLFELDAGTGAAAVAAMRAR